MKSIPHLLLVAIFCILSYGGYAQQDKREWSEGDLSWDDFTETIFKNGEGNLKYELTYERFSEKVDNVLKVKRYIAKLYMNKELSWIKPENKTDIELRYFQLIFDIAELSRRSFQNKLVYSGYIHQVEELNYFTNLELRNRFDELDKELVEGKKEDVLDRWEQIIDDELNYTKAPLIPDFEIRNICSAWYVGTGAMVMNGELTNYIDASPVTFNFGFELGYKRVMFISHVSAGFGKVSQTFYHNKVEWEAGLSVTPWIVDLGLQYTLFNLDRWKISPYISYSPVSIDGPSVLDDKDEEATDIMRDFTPGCGINLDYKLRKKISFLNDSQGQGTYVETILRTRFSVNKAEFTPQHSGYYFNVMVGIGSFTNLIRIKK